MPKIERGKAAGAGKYWTVLVKPNELVVESGKRYPNSTWLGTINARGTINVWSPAGYKPRGYRQAAKQMLEDARQKLCKQGKLPARVCRR